MNFCFIRLGKSSVDEIYWIDSLKGEQKRSVSIKVLCTQVPDEADKGTLCFIWLGSDNNKGTPTEWKQGLRAFGVIAEKQGGPGYNDEWELKVRILFVFKESVNKMDLLEANPSTYTEFAGMPVIGLVTSTNQTVQLIKPDGKEKQDIRALLDVLSLLDGDFTQTAARLEVPESSETVSRRTKTRRQKNRIEPDLFAVVPEAPGKEEEDTPPFDEHEDIGNAVIKEPFDPTKIDIRPQPLTIISLIKRLQSNRLDLDTDFQRSKDLWSKVNQSKLIESLLIRIPLPAFYFDGTSDTWLIVDGLQRISALNNFIIRKELKLVGLEFLKEYHGQGWDDLPAYLQARIEETAVTAYIINPGTPEAVKFNIFKRINTAGLSLTPQEIRNALNNGVPSKFVSKLAKQELFITAMGGKVPTERMQDKDYAARFLGFYLAEEEYKPDLDTFLNVGMSQLRQIDENQRDKILGDFNKAMKFAHSIFGENAFRKAGKSGRKMPVNKALFECTSVILAKMKFSELTKLEAKRGLVNTRMQELLTSNQVFIKAISSGTGDVKAVQDRYSILRQLFKQIIL